MNEVADKFLVRINAEKEIVQKGENNEIVPLRITTL